MKALLCIIGLWVSAFAIAEEKPLYKIISQTQDAGIPQDSILITGKVNYDKLPPKDIFGTISTLDFRSQRVVNRNGEYKILIHKNSRGFYFYQQGYREVVIRLKELGQFNRYEINITGETYFAIQMVEKPVIYCYSPSEIETEITLLPKGILSFTYPIYDKKWRIKTTENNAIMDLNTGKVHPYLFWEANQSALNFKMNDNTMNGFLVDTDTIIPFLEVQLKAIGLNEIESTDFITYWAPRLMQKEYALIQFLVNSEYTHAFGDIEFTVEPNCIQRVGMLFTGLDKIPNSLKVHPQEFPSINRHGFTVIEWGGVELSSMSKILARI